MLLLRVGQPPSADAQPPSADAQPPSADASGKAPGAARPEATTDAPAGPYRQLHALCIGINNYLYEDIPDLAYAENDARDMAGVLQNEYGFNNVTLLLGVNATRQKISDALAALQDPELVDPTDGVIIFFSGHGQTVPGPAGEIGYLLPFDAEVNLKKVGNPAQYRKSAVRMDDLRIDADNIPARHVLFLVDSCYAGYLASKAIGYDAPDVKNAMKYPARQVITAGTKGEQAVEHHTLGHGVFTFKVLEYLRAEEEPISATALGARMKQVVPREVAARAPDYTLTPQAKYLSGDGDFYLIRKGYTWKPEGSAGVPPVNVQPSGPSRPQDVTPPPSTGKSETAAWEALGKLENMASNANPERQVAMYESFVSEWSGTAAAKDAEKTLDQVKADWQATIAAVELQRIRIEEEKQERDRRLAEAEQAAFDGAKRLDEAGDHAAALAAWEKFIADHPKSERLYEAQARITHWKSQGPNAGDTRDIDLDGGVSLTLVYIPPGTFTMGSPSSEANREDDEGPQTKVTISKGFWMGETEVTQAQWRAVMGSDPSYFKGDTLPVEAVTWNDSVDFCKKLSAKAGMSITLPTEAHWEYACRAGTTTRFSSGDRDEDLRGIANLYDQSCQESYDWSKVSWNDGHGYTAPVRSFKPNAFGLYDMHGNVWEWCSDWYADKLPGGSVTDPTGPNTGSARVRRGGSWFSLPSDCRSANRDWDGPLFRIYSDGFRVLAAQ